jgi:hypothetical protein
MQLIATVPVMTGDNSNEASGEVDVVDVEFVGGGIAVVRGKMGLTLA